MSRTKPDSVVTPTPDPESEHLATASEGQKQVRSIRHAHLYLTRLDPWSVMKSAFMLSLAIAIVILVATAVVWLMLTASGTLSAVTKTIDDVAGSGASALDLSGLLSFGKVMGFALTISLIEVVLISAMATLFAYMYNIAVGLTGGLQITLTEDS